ncbi:MAG: NUDIX domain-containing protein [Chloroflexi bacterium]|nr:NUDIX domain-containing protein [Chloroflexota bacterium]
MNSKPVSGDDPTRPTADSRLPTPSVRHLTATGFLVWEDTVLLHWHRKNRLWLPFGGHIEANEDPVQTVLREIEEECGVAAELIDTGPQFELGEQRQLPPPVTILLERATDGRMWHEHIDLIYFCRPRTDIAGLAIDRDPTLRWLSETDLESNWPIAPGAGEAAAEVPVDVRMLGIEAIRAGRT